MHFSLNEKVIFLNEKGGGIVRGFKPGNIVIVEDDTGFELDYPVSELGKVYGKHDAIPDQYLAAEGRENEINYKAKDKGFIYKHKDYWEVDLHTHHLLDSKRGYTNGQLLNHQMVVFKRTFRKATDTRLRKLIVIHGVGKGVLREEIRNFLAGRENIAYYDADFRKYGKGATEIRLYYK